MGKVTLVIGGARSGKSSMAHALALGAAKGKKARVAFIATAQALDTEMDHRIRTHKKERPGTWKTFEEPYDVQGVLSGISGFDVVVVDCVTLLVTNYLLQGKTPKQIERSIKHTCAAAKKCAPEVIFVSNEVGLGIVPDNKLARDFRDVAGRANQAIAAASDSVYAMVAGISVKIK